MSLRYFLAASLPSMQIAYLKATEWHILQSTGNNKYENIFARQKGRFSIVCKIIKLNPEIFLVTLEIPVTP